MRSLAVAVAPLLFGVMVASPLAHSGDYIGAMILPDVHDPAQLVLHSDHLLLYASAIEWRGYSLVTREWEFLGDDLYGEDKPLWDAAIGSTGHLVSSVLATRSSASITLRCLTY